MAAPTPVTDGARVFALFAICDLAAFDRDGRLLWYRSLAGDYPTIGNNVGMAASPVLYGDSLFVAMENVGESFAAALDARTGRNVWKHARSAKINWTTPFVRKKVRFLKERGRERILTFDEERRYLKAARNPLKAAQPQRGTLVATINA